jgi:DNA-binding PadR family transcriptional regulator
MNILRQLAERDKFALELVEGSGGGLTTAAIYVHLSRLLKKGLVETRDITTYTGSGPPRVLYNLSDKGRQVVTAVEMLRSALEDPS